MIVSSAEATLVQAVCFIFFARLQMCRWILVVRPSRYLAKERWQLQRPR